MRLFSRMQAWLDAWVTYFAPHQGINVDKRQYIHMSFLAFRNTLQSHFLYWGQRIHSHSITPLNPLFLWHFDSTCGRMVLFPFPTLWTIPEMQSGPANPSKSARIRNVLLRSKGLPKAQQRARQIDLDPCGDDDLLLCSELKKKISKDYVMY